MPKYTSQTRPKSESADFSFLTPSTINMSAAEQPCYTLIGVPNGYEFPKEETLREKFENGE